MACLKHCSGVQAETNIHIPCRTSDMKIRSFEFLAQLRRLHSASSSTDDHSVSHQRWHMFTSMRLRLPGTSRRQPGHPHPPTLRCHEVDIDLFLCYLRLRHKIFQPRIILASIPQPSTHSHPRWSAHYCVPIISLATVCRILYLSPSTFGPDRKAITVPILEHDVVLNLFESSMVL